jgi:hypothetical protein
VFYVFLLLMAAAGVAVYLLFFLAHVPGAKEERFGELEALPEDLGQWKTIEQGPDAEAATSDGLRREERVILQDASGMFAKGRLLKQVRFRSLETNEIVRILPEQVIERKRKK